MRKVKKYEMKEEDEDSRNNNPSLGSPDSFLYKSPTIMASHKTT